MRYLMAFSRPAHASTRTAAAARAVDHPGDAARVAEDAPPGGAVACLRGAGRRPRELQRRSAGRAAGGAAVPALRGPGAGVVARSFPGWSGPAALRRPAGSLLRGRRVGRADGGW